MTLDKFLYGDTDKEKEAYQKGFMDGMRAAKVEDGYFKDDEKIKDWICSICGEWHSDHEKKLN